MEVLLQTQQKINQLHSIRKDNINNEQNLQTQNKLNSTNNKVQPKSNVCNKSDQALTKQAQENTQKCQIELSNLQNAIEKYNIFKCINSRSIKQSDIMVDESDEYLVSFLFSRFGEQNQKMQLNQNTKFDYSNQRHQDTIKKQKPSQAFNLSTFKEDLSINPLDINGQYNLVGLVEKNEIKINYDSTKSTIFNTCIKFSEDQQNLFTVSDSEGAVVLLDLVNLQQIGLLQKQNKCVRVLDWQSPFVVTAAGKNNVKKKYISQEFKLSQSNEVLSLRWNANKQDFVYSGSNKEISVWSSLQQNAPIFTQQSSHIFNVRALSWSNLKSNHFITGGGNEDGTLKLWDYHTQKNLYSVQAQNQITNILTPQNQFHGYFMTTYNTQSNAIEIWFEKNDSTLQKKVSLSTEQQKIVYGAISNFDDKVITSSSNGNFNLWESFN